MNKFIGEYKRAATGLAEKFGIEPIFAAGPLLDLAKDAELSPFKVVRSLIFMRCSGRAPSW